MKLSATVLALSVSMATAFQPTAFPATRAPLALSMASADSEGNSRRALMNSAASLLVGVGAQALVAESASASLLDEYGADPTTITAKGKQERKEREAVKGVAKTESNFEPNLRSNYYYPTNKKRYLPRIKKCNDAIPDAAQMIGTQDWEGAETFAIKIADDTILPMKLYTSSLLGGGTNVKVSFAKDMNQAASDFEKAQKKLVKAISKKDQEKSSRALEDLSSALLAYRTAGRLLGPDGGGDIPSVDEIRRAACRVQGRTFEQKVKARDARLADTGK